MSIHLKWMVLGSSPSAKEFHEVPQVDRVVSAGDAILLQRPDYYVLSEECSVLRFEEERAEMRKKGTQVVVIERLVDGKSKLNFLASRTPKGFVVPHDISLPMRRARIAQDWQLWRPGSYICGTAGSIALQFAVNNFPSEVHLVGMEGYLGEEHVDYFSGQKGNFHSGRITVVWYGPLVQHIVDLCPKTDFIFYGNMKYPIDGFNVTKVPCLEKETV